MYIKPPDTDPEEETGITRRKVLTATGALASASIAGCAGSSNEGSGSSGSGGGQGTGEKLPAMTLTGYPPSNRNVHETLNLIVEELNNFGFEVEYEGMNRERQLSKVYYERDYDISSLGYTGRPNRLDPHMLLYKNYHSSQTGRGNYNWTNYANAEADRLLDKQATILDRDERKKAINDVQKLLMQHPAGEMPIEHDQLVNVYNNRKWEGFVEVAGLGLKNIWTWTQVKPKTNKNLLTAAFPLEIPYITPLQPNEANLITQRLTHDRLLRVGPDGLPKPWLAKDWTVSEDDTVVTMPLRNDVKFHDGEQLTAKDVVFTFQYLKEYESPFFASAINPIEAVEQTGDYSVKFTLKEPFAPIFLLTFARVHILPEHIWKNVPGDVGVDQPYKWSPTSSEYGLVGSGPYKFEEWRKGEGILLSPNKEHPVAPPNVNELFLRSVSNPSAMLTGLKNQSIDFVIRASTIDTSALEDSISNNDYLTMQRTDSVGYDELSMNTDRAPLDQASVRAAMSALIPKETIVTEIWDDYARVANSPTSPVLQFWHNTDVKKWSEEGAEGATRMLEEAGLDAAGDTIYYRDSKPSVSESNDWKLGDTRG